MGKQIASFFFILLIHPAVGQAIQHRTQFIEYPSFDGTRIQALYQAPKSMRLGAPPPLIVIAHDGPAESITENPDPLRELLVNSGFAVLAPNYRGSIGRDQRFRELNYMDWGKGDLQDLVEGVRYLVSQKRIAPSRVGILGTGYGGFLVLAALSKSSDVWTAGVGIGPTANLVFENPPANDPRAGWYQREIGAPALFLGRIHSPILLFQGAHDTEVPRTESDVLYAALLQNKVPVGLIVYPNEGHVFTQKESVQDFHRRVLEFFRKQLRKNTL